MSYTEFLTNYYVDKYTVSPDISSENDGLTIVDKVNEHETSTNFLELHIDNQILENVTDTVTVVFPAVDPTEHESVAIDFVYTVSHNHVWPEFNPDYLLAGETNTVQVKGKKINGTWAMISELAEHFKNYDNSYLQNNHVSRTIALDDTIEQKGAKISDGSIYLTDPLTVPSKDYVVKMTDELANGRFCSQLYTVRFVSPFVVSLEDVELKTLIANADAKNLDSYITIEDADGNEIVKFDAETNSLALTEVAKSTYGLTEVPERVYAPKFNETGNDTRESFGGNLEIANNVIIWDNDGTDLQNNKVAHFTATVTFDKICTLTEEADVTVLSTANSKGETTELPTPNTKQFIYSDGEMEWMLDLGVTTSGKLTQAVNAGDTWMAYSTMVYDYEIIPTDKTSGVIKCSNTSYDEVGREMSREYLILYSNMTTNGITLYSPVQFGYEQGDPEGLGIVKVDENWNTHPVEATVATEKQTIEVIENPIMW